MAGDGAVDHVLPGLAIDPPCPIDYGELSEALARADLVIVENLCSLPLNPLAWKAVAEICRGRRTILHHHDLPWQRPQYSEHPPPPDDPSWLHVTINELSREELAVRGIGAVVIYNTFSMDGPLGERGATRELLGIGREDRLVLQPTRAIPRKNVRGGLAVAEALGATFWLLGPAEDGYGPELDDVLARTTVPVRHGPVRDGAGSIMADAYAACDVVALPSTWEGFGNPAVESAVHRRPLVIGRYPVSRELAAFGFRWFRTDETPELREWLESPDDLLEHNYELARRYFSVSDLPSRIDAAMRATGWEW